MIGTTLNQRFTLEVELGRGGMGTVYRATDQVLQRSVAIKVLGDLRGPEVGARLRLEAQITARLVHDHIVRLYDFGLDGEISFFVMEEVDGSSFHERFRRMELPQRLGVLAEVAEALDYAHHQGVIHRDVKPANILLTSADRPKLSDFGLSILSDTSIEEAGTVRGTPHYMSPEQARGHRVDHRTDLYSLGVILYECATGAPPFQGPVVSILSQHVNAEPEPARSRVPGLNPELDALITNLLAKKPGDRLGSGREVAQRLRELTAKDSVGGGTSTITLGSPTRASTPAPASKPASDSALESAGSGSGEKSGAGSGEKSGVPAMASVSSSDVRASVSSAPRVVPGQPGSVAVRDIIDVVTAEPMALDPDDRYLGGHYLAYLLGGSRRQGIWLRRPLDPLNADRARLLLAMTYLMTVGLEDGTLERAAALLDERPDVRPVLSPLIVMKYLDSRSTPKRRRPFRHARQQLAEASSYAAKHLTDERGLLNPGLMPQVLDDLRKVAPARVEVDDQLVQRWNRVSDVWRSDPQFRDCVLRYATRAAYRDPASIDLWPEVVYPLIERARWQRHLRSHAEAFWDVMGAGLRLPDRGVRLDNAIRVAIPEQVAAKLDVSLDAFEDEPVLGELEAAEDAEAARVGRMKVSPHSMLESIHDMAVADDQNVVVPLVNPDPIRPTMGELRAVWRETIAALRSRNTNQGTAVVRGIPVGPYRLVTVASIRSRSAGTIVLQGMAGKQIEMLIPSFSGGGADSRVMLAVWLYQNQSAGITYYDNLGDQRYIVWDSGASVQHKFDAPEDFNRELYQIGLEIPDQLDRVLTKRYRPRTTA